MSWVIINRTSTPQTHKPYEEPSLPPKTGLEVRTETCAERVLQDLPLSTERSLMKPRLFPQTPNNQPTEELGWFGGKF